LNQVKFFDVFNCLKPYKELKDYFEDTYVIRVVASTNNKNYHVFITSDHIIPKDKVFEMEEAIYNALFANKDRKIKIHETFKLQGVYTPIDIWNEYFNSILLEGKSKSEILYQFLKTVKVVSSSENGLKLKGKDSLVFKAIKTEAYNFLEDIFKNRFGKDITLDIGYEEKEDEMLKFRSQMIVQELDEARNVVLEQEEQTKENKKVEANQGNSEDKDNESKSKDKVLEGGLKSFAKNKGKSKNNFYKKSEGMLTPEDDPTILWGKWKKEEEEKIFALEDVKDAIGVCEVEGEILSIEKTFMPKISKYLIKILLTDYTDSINLKVWQKEDDMDAFNEKVREHKFVKVRGVAIFDTYDKEIEITSPVGIKEIKDFRNKRVDNAPVKRVELHCHTNMSEMDAIDDVSVLVNRAHEFGHQAIAVTDHGVVQAFPTANHAVEKFGEEDPFKVIYGVEGYLVDDVAKIAKNEKGQKLSDTFVVFDIETTGFNRISDRIIEIGAKKVVNGKIEEGFSEFVNPQRPIPFNIVKLTGINDAMVKNAPSIEVILPKFLEFVGDAVLVAHNADFDTGFIFQNMRNLGLVPDFTYVDTLNLARVLVPSISSYKLDRVAKALNLTLENHHRAIDDATTTADIFVKFISMLEERDVFDLKGINQLGDGDINKIRKAPYFHVIILAKNETGRVNLYKIISASHLDYFAKKPRIPKSLLKKYRDGLIVGSACEAGEVYQALLNSEEEEKIAKLVEFYDYLEIQPVTNNEFMIRDDRGRFPNINTIEDIQNMNKKVIELGEKYNKLVVATCDAHFCDPEEAIYRKIIQAGNGYKDADEGAMLYFRTTTEMLEEFEYLGSEKAFEVVITNTNKIADQIEKMSPVYPDKCPPELPNSEENLRKICYDNAHEKYGNPLPKIVEDRLEKELASIIGNGYSVMYIIAQKLVHDSVEHGYLVGSRGSVGSSFVATMADITEVNPLSPHYYCPNCKYSDFESEEVKKYAGTCGFDMPDKVCPVCGKPLKKDGFDIPFETFLGFDGDKEPDIDLNFSADYQAKAHSYTAEIFKDGSTFKAGTIGGIAEKTAWGYVKAYFEEREISKRPAEIERLASHITGIKRTTGQHPGGIVVCPAGYDINLFTPVQYPANKAEKGVITTHFDYHSIDHNLLKLDILGHDDPTMIKYLEEYITSDSMPNEYNENNPFKATSIPLDDKGVMKLYEGTEVLGVTPEEIKSQVGTRGVPEFGTNFTMQMIVDAKPTTFSALVRISGLSHGTDVWVGNAKDLILSGTATISTAICTRDDIMTFLIEKGLPASDSFKIMESVRKGRGLRPEWEDLMREYEVPEWYIDSCKKIKYMFPKAHAAAYVMMAYRIAYCKLNYPLAYYAAFFSIRAKAFSYEIMCMGKENLLAHIAELEGMDKLSKKDEDTLSDCYLVLEFYVRGFTFLPIDIYKSKANRFVIDGNSLLPSFNTIDGNGDTAAESMEKAEALGEYLSVEDFQNRTKANNTIVEKMRALGIFEGLKKNNQMSLFDF
jgi:DNA polymerase-3 subunit alpha (Gram-positive type)